MKFIFISLLFCIIFFSCDYIAPQVEREFHSPQDVVNFLNSFRDEGKSHITDINIKSTQEHHKVTPFLVSFKKSLENTYGHGVWIHQQFHSEKEAEKLVNKVGLYKFIAFDLVKPVYLKEKEEYHVFYLRTDMDQYRLENIKYDEVDEEEIDKKPFITLIKKITIIIPRESQDEISSENKSMDKKKSITEPIVSRVDSIHFSVKDSVISVSHAEYAFITDPCKENPGSDECKKIGEGGVGGGGSPINDELLVKYTLFHKREVILTGVMSSSNPFIIGDERVSRLDHIHAEFSVLGGKEIAVSSALQKQLLIEHQSL